MISWVPVSQSLDLRMSHSGWLIAFAVSMNSFCWQAENCTRPDMIPGPSAGSARKRAPGQKASGCWAYDCEPRRCFVTKMISSLAGRPLKIVCGVAASPSPPGMLCIQSRQNIGTHDTLLCSEASCGVSARGCEAQHRGAQRMPPNHTAPPAGQHE